MSLEEVYGQLAQVIDPELDEPLTELGFIGGVDISGGAVNVRFRLPTYWCSSNFAFLMAFDIRERVSELPWVEKVEVQLQDHFADEEINGGVNGGKSFLETFPDDTTEDLESLRENFRAKAFHARQERLLRWLFRSKWKEADILAVRIGELDGLMENEQWKELVARYLEVRRERGLADSDDSPAFSHPDGAPMTLGEFQGYIRKAGSMRMAMEFNTSLCRGLLKTRYGGTDGGGGKTLSQDNELLRK